MSSRQHVPSGPGPGDARATVLITRPQAAADRLAGELSAIRGVNIVVSPILRIALSGLSVPVDGDSVLVLSSAHAVAALLQSGGAQGQTAYCVGDATARAAAAAGLRALSASGDAEALAALVIALQAPGPLVWLHGAHSRPEFSPRLRAAGFTVHEAVVYDQIAQSLSAPARGALAGGRPVILPLFSPRSATLLGAACAGAAAPLDLVCISPAARDAWQGPSPAAASVAKHPDGAAMLDLLRCRIAAYCSG